MFWKATDVSFHFYLVSMIYVALKTKKLLISVTLLTFFNEPHLKIPVLTVFFGLKTTLDPITIYMVGKLFSMSRFWHQGLGG